MSTSNKGLAFLILGGVCCAIFAIMMKGADISSILFTLGCAIAFMVSLHMLVQLSRNSIPIGAVIVIWICIAIIVITAVTSLLYGNLLGVISLGIGLYFIAESIENKISIGAIFATVVGIVIVVTTVQSILFHDDPINLLRVLFMCLVIGSVIGICVSYSKKHEEVTE